MIYVMSDLHGEYNKFIKMLDLINFSPEDTLYILGDVMDRGWKSIDIIDYIRKPENSNIKLIKGNHEVFCSRGLLEENVFPLWMENGGYFTYSELQYRGAEYTYELLKFLESLPTYAIVDNYILVHAGIEISDSNVKDIDSFMESQDEDILLWDREFISSDRYLEGYTVVCGHTPTTRYIEDGKASITHFPGKILIDCGAFFTDSGGRLGCLRLDDLKEFYVE